MQSQRRGIIQARSYCCSRWFSAFSRLLCIIIPAIEITTVEAPDIKNHMGTPMISARGDATRSPRGIASDEARANSEKARPIFQPVW